MAIFKKHGAYWLDYYVDGKRKRECVGPNFKLAKDVLFKRKAEAVEHANFPERADNRKPFKELSSQYLRLHGPRLKSLKTWKGIIRELDAEFGATPVGKIKAPDIQAYYNRIESRASTSTANRHLTLLKSIFNKAFAWGTFHGESPCARIKRKREPNHRLRYLSGEEIRSLLFVADDRLRPILVCALSTGMRKGELLELDWRDVDFVSGTIHLLRTKSGKPRKIPMMAGLRSMLLQMVPKESGPVFELPEISLRRLFAKALADARIAEFRFHDLRHTFASYFAMKTGDLPALQQLLGHATVQMTMRYAHLSDQHVAEKMAKLEGSLPALTYSPTQSEQARSCDVHHRDSLPG